MTFLNLRFSSNETYFRSIKYPFIKTNQENVIKKLCELHHSQLIMFHTSFDKNFTRLPQGEFESKLKDRYVKIPSFKKLRKFTMKEKKTLKTISLYRTRKHSYKMKLVCCPLRVSFRMNVFSSCCGLSL